ncbi:hypothetical protein EFA46_011720 (plasmid) [Halarchaeum sp. CBA1220]|uniref:hypothetical protein n=1 Tax=Halarchaeum sp. CBA1220 TaxID=1853682 RepID=UPI000F3A8117|nr:hypothetical protein [Halarchaeum sp. CBA1220]QLC34922.1 hypothetical protein EFA46_011720 [Halarchaeum sp. CBA1220]
MTRRSRRALLAATGTALTGALAGCSSLNPLSGESGVEYDESAFAELPGDLPAVPAAEPVAPARADVVAARERLRSLLDDADVSRVPNEVVRDELARERESARDALTEDAEASVDALAALTYPRSEAMFAHAGLAAFDGDLDASAVAARRERHRREAEAFLADYRYDGPPNDPAGALAEHARIEGWARTGARLIGDADRRREYENTVLHVAERASAVEWGRAYAADARRLRERYASTLDGPREYGRRFARVSGSLVADVESHASAPDWEAVTSGFERDVAGTPAERLLTDLASDRWSGARGAVAHRDAGRYAAAVVPAMRALAADRALADAEAAVAEGGYALPESVDPISAERTAAVEGLRALLDTAPTRLARRLAAYVRSSLRSADRYARDEHTSMPGRDLYAQYATANRFAAAAPAVVRRVGDALAE